MSFFSQGFTEVDSYVLSRISLGFIAVLERKKNCNFLFELS